MIDNSIPQIKQMIKYETLLFPSNVISNVSKC